MGDVSKVSTWNLNWNSTNFLRINIPDVPRLDNGAEDFNTNIVLVKGIKENLEVDVLASRRTINALSGIISHFLDNTTKRKVVLVN